MGCEEASRRRGSSLQFFGGGEEILHHPKRDGCRDPRTPHLTFWQAQRVLLGMAVQDFHQWGKFERNPSTMTNVKLGARGLQHTEVVQDFFRQQ